MFERYCFGKVYKEFQGLVCCGDEFLSRKLLLCGDNYVFVSEARLSTWNSKVTWRCVVFLCKY